MEGEAEERVVMPVARQGASSQVTIQEYFRQERDLMEAVVERQNMEKALRRVMSNKGVLGVNGLRVEDLRGHLVRHWPQVKEALLSGEYMARVARKVKDKRVLRLIRCYLQAGMLQGGVETQRVEGTPQGGPLSPLLSNILLDDLDMELEKRGHAFCRYADDCNIYVKTRRSGERVLTSVRRFLEERLKLRVNESKSGVHRPWNRKFLGYSMTMQKSPRLRVAPEVLKRLQYAIRDICRRGRGRWLRATILALAPELRGFAAYFRSDPVRHAGLAAVLETGLRRYMASATGDNRIRAIAVCRSNATDNFTLLRRIELTGAGQFR
ncbi:MAG: hypothetical protein LBS65_03810 [Desulfovibrio sp.]|jgi:hypothetical protein|nr:hypothetical protein [Desulfovibrio sp.]